MKPAYMDIIRFMLTGFLTGKTELIPENRNACRTVWDRLTPKEQDLVYYYVTSHEKHDVLITRQYAVQTGTSPDAAWATLKRIFRDVAVQRGIWPDPDIRKQKAKEHST